MPHSADPTPVWFVTGASKGMGLETVRAALAAGARVAATSRDAARLSEAVGAPEGRFLAVEMSFDSEHSIQAAVDTAVETFGRLDVLVNNAGYALLGGVEEFSDHEVRANFDVNVFGLLAVTRAVLPVMRGQRSGTILNMASISANATGPATGLYSATKAAVLMLSEALADEVESLGISVTAICPGGVRTDFLDPSSARRAARRIADYTVVERTTEAYARLNHNQGGDPARVADVLVMLSQSENPPRRLYLGADAVHAIESICHQTVRDAERYKRISLSV